MNFKKGDIVRLNHKGLKLFLDEHHKYNIYHLDDVFKGKFTVFSQGTQAVWPTSIIKYYFVRSYINLVKYKFEEDILIPYDKIQLNQKLFIL